MLFIGLFGPCVCENGIRPDVVMEQQFGKSKSINDRYDSDGGENPDNESLFGERGGGARENDVKRQRQRRRIQNRMLKPWSITPKGEIACGRATYLLRVKWISKIAPREKKTPKNVWLWGVYTINKNKCDIMIKSICTGEFIFLSQYSWDARFNSVCVSVAPVDDNLFCFLFISNIYKALAVFYFVSLSLCPSLGGWLACLDALVSTITHASVRVISLRLIIATHSSHSFNRWAKWIKWASQLARWVKFQYI